MAADIVDGDGELSCPVLSMRRTYDGPSCVDMLHQHLPAGRSATAPALEARLNIIRG